MAMKSFMAATAALLMGLGPSAAQANSISDVENARAKDRAGYHLNRQDREKLRRHGRNDDYGYYGGGYADDGYYGGPVYGGGGVSVYVGPGRHYGGYYDD